MSSETLKHALPLPFKIKLDNKNYTLTEIVGQGGSSIVYKGRCDEAPEHEHDIIKELFPHGCGITRDEDGALVVPESTMELLGDLRELALHEFRVANELRMANEGKDKDSRFFRYSMPTAHNNTLYTIIGTEFGITLYDLMQKNRIISFIDMCKFILSILDDAVIPLHHKRFLHLDIAPDNIRFSKKDGKLVEIGDARLIDFNSAYKLDYDAEINRRFSSKPGYSAPELVILSASKNVVAKPLSLCYATDLYSVCAIFFEMLKGRKYGKAGDTSRSKFTKTYLWELTDKDPCVKGMSTLLIKKINDLLVKGLAYNPLKRHKDSYELRAEVNELVNLCEELKLAHFPKRPYPYFVCRESELDQIDELLVQDNYVIIEGIGGIGKSELAKRYAWLHQDKYDIVQFITFNDSLLSTISTSLKFLNFDDAKYFQNYSKDEVEQRIFNAKMSCLQKHDKRTLIVIDNYNVPADDNFHRLVSSNASNGYRVIFTSREKHDENVLEISNFETRNELFKLFNTYFAPAHLTPEAEPVVEKIIDLVLGHTMTIMLIALTMRTSKINAQDMLDRLKSSLDPNLPEKIPVNKEEISAKIREQVMYTHIKTLFDMTEIENNYILFCIMIHMTIVSYKGLSMEYFQKWVLSKLDFDGKDNIDIYNIEWLMKRRWIEFNEDTNEIALHPVISDVAFSVLKPDSIACSLLLKSMIEFAKENIAKTYVEWQYCMSMLELACKRIRDKTKITADMATYFAALANKLGKYDVAMEYYEESVKIYENLPTKQEQTGKIVAYSGIADTHDGLGEYGSALKWYRKTLRSYWGTLYSYLLTNEHGDDFRGSVYLKMAEIRLKQGEYPKAVPLYESAAIFQGKEHVSVALTHASHKLTKAAFIGKSMASPKYRKALEVFERISDKNPLHTAIVYEVIADAHYRKCEYIEALEKYKKSLAIREDIQGKGHPAVVFVCINMARSYCALENYPKALEWLFRALEFSEDISVIYGCIAGVYLCMENYEDALKQYQKALEVCPDSSIIHNSIARVGYLKGNYNHALEQYRKITAQHSADAQVVYGSFASMYHKNDFLTVTRWYDKVSPDKEHLFSAIYADVCEFFLKPKRLRLLRFLRGLLAIVGNILVPASLPFLGLPLFLSMLFPRMFIWQTAIFLIPWLLPLSSLLMVFLVWYIRVYNIKRRGASELIFLGLGVLGLCCFTAMNMIPILKWHMTGLGGGFVIMTKPIFLELPSLLRLLGITSSIFILLGLIGISIVLAKLFARFSNLLGRLHNISEHFVSAAYHSLGEYYYNSGDYRKALRWYIKCYRRILLELLLSKFKETHPAESVVRKEMAAIYLRTDSQKSFNIWFNKKFVRWLPIEYRDFLRIISDA